MDDLNRTGFFLHLWADDFDPGDPDLVHESVALGVDGRWYRCLRIPSAPDPASRTRVVESSAAAALAWLLAHGRAVPAELEHVAAKRGVATFNHAEG